MTKSKSHTQRLLIQSEHWDRRAEIALQGFFELKQARMRQARNALWWAKLCREVSKKLQERAANDV